MTEDVSLKAGAVTIAMRSNVPLIPAAYIGPSSVKRINKGKRAQLIFGDPIQIDAEEQIDRKTAMKMMTDRLNEKFEELKEALQSNQSKKKTTSIDGRLFYYYYNKGKGDTKVIQA